MKRLVRRNHKQRRFARLLKLYRFTTQRHVYWDDGDPTPAIIRRFQDYLERSNPSTWYRQALRRRTRARLAHTLRNCKDMDALQVDNPARLSSLNGWY